MSRTFAFALDSDPVALGYLVEITRNDGTVHRFTTAQEDVVIGANTFVATPAVELSKIENRSDGSVANAEIKVATIAGGFIAPNDVKQRKFNGATCKIYLASLL